MNWQLVKNYALPVIGLIIALAAYFLHQDAKTIDVQKASENLEQSIEEKLENADEVLERFNFTALENNDFTSLYQTYGTAYEDDGTLIAAYSNGTLSFWSSNLVPVPLVDTMDISSRIVHLDNGWYLLSKAFKKEHTAYVLTLIKTEYIYSNKYLHSGFHEDYQFPFKSHITTDQSKSGISVNLNGSFLFTVVIDDASLIDGPDTQLLFPLLYFIGIALILVFLYQKAKRLVDNGKPWIGFFLFSVPLLVFRYWTLSDQSPSIVYSLDLFDPLLYAQSTWLPSLGDLFLNAFVFFLIVYLLYRCINSMPGIQISRFLGAVIQLSGLLLLYYIAHQLNGIFSGLVINSQINFEVGNVFDLNAYSFVGILNFGLPLFTFLILCTCFVRLGEKADLKANLYYFLLSLITSLYIVLSILFTDYDLIQILWPVAIIMFTGFINLSRRISLTFAPVVGLLLINAYVAAHVILKYSDEKEINDRLFYAKWKLAYDDDWLTEKSYADLEPELKESDVLKSAFNKSNFDKAQFDHVLETNYFNNYWDKYDITFNLFAKDSLPVGNNTSSPKDFEQLSDIITRSGIPSSFNNNIYLISNYDHKLNYVIHLVIPGENAEPAGHLFCELKSKKLPKDIGFPELLIDDNTQTIEALSGYSFARYLDSSLITTLGNYNYSISPQHLEEILGENQYTIFDENGYNHLAYRVNERIMIVLGKPIASFLEKATSFSYLFAIFSLVLLVAIAIKEIRRITDLRRMTLKSKIQLVIIGLILTCLVLFGVGTRFFIEKQYTDKNNKLISEKIRSVNVEVKKKLDGVEIIPAGSNFLNSIMHKFSLVFFTDINFYDVSGTLLASSRHEMFNAGLLSRKMQPKAFIELNTKNRSEYVQEERVGKMVYLSAYVPYVSEKGKVLGYLNLPYFAKQNPLENEISNFLVAIINIFVVLFALSVVAALFVSNWVTKPLRFLQTSVSSLELGKSNTPIQYTGQDEIGDLVQEYNKKVTELEDAVSLLARTERESAWRDMAKQVAHEIKNPLTPMKLSVQHFQRSFDKDDPKAQERIERFSQTLIEQIETLTTIANEFSTFAKMPAAKIEDVDLSSILENTVALFNESDDTEVVFENNVSHPVVIRYDNDHILRVLNNLIKNAIQSIPYDREGNVQVFLDDKEDNWLIEVKDNGSGIPDDKLDQIFVPNFTTKSKGMGLGLSMVKSIVQNAGGKVWFETEYNVGTSFFVELPKQ